MERSVAKLVEQLKRHPVQPKEAPGRYGLYLLDIKDGDVTLIADQPAPGLTRCASPVWSHDGRRILFDATPGVNYTQSRLWSIEAGEGRPTVTDVGKPAAIPASRRQTTSLRLTRMLPTSRSGVWTMHADGSNHRFLGDYGRAHLVPGWPAAHDHELWNCEAGEVDGRGPGKERTTPVPRPPNLPRTPAGSGAGTIVAVIGPDVRLEGQITGDTIALIDLSRTRRRPRSRKSCGKKANANDLKPSFSVYSATLGRCLSSSALVTRERRFIRFSEARRIRRNDWGRTFMSR